MRYINVVMYRNGHELLCIKSMTNILGRKLDHESSTIILSAHPSTFTTDRIGRVMMTLKGRSTNSSEVKEVTVGLDESNDWSVVVTDEWTVFDEVVVTVRVTGFDGQIVTTNSLVFLVEPAFNSAEDTVVSQETIRKLLKSAIVNVTYDRKYDRWNFVNLDGDVRAYISLSDKGELIGRLLG